MGDGMSRVSIGTFSLETSPGWTLSTVILAGPVDDTPPEPSLLQGPTSRRFQRNLVATMEEVAEDETPENYVRRQVDGLGKARVERRQVGDPRKVELAGGLQGLITEQLIVGDSGERVHQMQLVCIRQHVAHTLITSHLEGVPFDAAREEFEQMLLSFR